jgi:hypothetical protein
VNPDLRSELVEFFEHRTRAEFEEFYGVIDGPNWPDGALVASRACDLVLAVPSGVRSERDDDDARRLATIR